MKFRLNPVTILTYIFYMYFIEEDVPKCCIYIDIGALLSMNSSEEFKRMFLNYISK